MIETDRLVLRPMRSEDVDPLLAVFADPRVMASFGGILFDRDDMERWVRRNLVHQEHFGYGLFAVLRKPDGLLIGDCGLEHFDGDADEAELGYDLRSDHWHRGFATEAAIALRDDAFMTLEISRLISLIRHGHDASRRVAERIGMRRIEDVLRDGRVYWRFAIERTDAPRHGFAATLPAPVSPLP